MNNASQLRLVAKNSYLTRLKSFSFWAMVIGPLMIPLIGILVSFLAGGNTTPQLAIVNQPALVQVFKADKSSGLDVTAASSASSARSKLAAGKIDGYLVANADDSYKLYLSTKSSHNLSADAISGILTQYQITQRASQMNLSQKQLASLLTPAKVTSTTQNFTTGQAQNASAAGANTAISMFATVFIFLMMTIYVGVISQEIANEKSNRIMEILLAATNTQVQYYGKILGILGLAFTQLAIYAVGLGGMYLGFRDNAAVKGVLDMVKGVNAGFFAYVTVTALVAIVAYLILASIVASLVNEQSQAQQAAQPVTYIGLIGYIAGIALNINPGNVPLQVLSFIPFVSPTMMAGRLAGQTVGMGEALIALGLQIVATIAIAFWGERIYARNVLSYSSESIVGQLVRSVTGRETKTKVVKIENVQNSDKKPWFKKRSSGIGYNPNTWQGWLIVIGAVVVIILIRNLLFKK
ncbi:MAG: ABC transporter permease [Streptococcaceae bacterium]|jgi:ABC-2 type transport system permease protein|nr:ABC transporter permease [Streptococcaceae bacterium]